jgi:predicted nucleotidyltransferase
MAKFESIIKRVIIALEKSQLKYVIVGGFAAIFRGRPRTTTDIDIIVEKDIQVKIAMDEGSNIYFFDKQSVLRIDFRVAKNLDEKEVYE